MTTIYVDGSVVVLPGASGRLVHLSDAGHVLVLVTAADDPAATFAAWPDRVGELPADPTRGSWFLTADPSTCHERQAGLSTILVAPRDDSPRPTRCDHTARDL
ncbi:MAG: hypothetical protein ABJC39_12900, partial [Chloroflexota bacterium]